ncbi:MAG: DUF3105 domain-containing protein [Candidatus Spechtbacterales bacterium]
MDNQPQQLSKWERRGLRRQEKQKFAEGELRKRTFKKISLWLIGLLVIGSSIYGLILLASKAEKERPGQSYSILGEEHIEVGASHPDYNSNPPTSGWHYGSPAEWGVYDRELPDEQLIHNLEHGGIWISYKDIDEDTKAKLAAIGKKYPGSVIITPRSANDSKIALASWGRLQNLENFDETAIIDFIKTNKNRSPEPIAR